MLGAIFSMTAIAFVIMATLAAVATTRTSPPVRGIADKLVNASSAAALISAGLAAWFLLSPST